MLDNAARYRGGSGSNSAWDGTYHSMLGMPRTSISKAGARPYCKTALTLACIVYIQKLRGCNA